MSKYSNCTKDEAIELIRTTDKELRYTYGLLYRNPTTKKVLVSREKALEYASDSIVDITEYADYVHINRFSSNDLF